MPDKMKTALRLAAVVAVCALIVMGLIWMTKPPAPGPAKPITLPRIEAPAPAPKSDRDDKRGHSDKAGQRDKADHGKGDRRRDEDRGERKSER